MSKKIFLLSFIFLQISCCAQVFDSVHVYVLNLNSFYTIKIDKDIIKNETELFVVSNPRIADSIFELLTKDIRGDVMSQAGDYVEIRLLFEFFTKGKVDRFISLTSSKLIYSDKKLFECRESNMAKLDRYIDGLTVRLGLKRDTD